MSTSSVKRLVLCTAFATLQLLGAAPQSHATTIKKPDVVATYGTSADSKLESSTEKEYFALDLKKGGTLTLTQSSSVGVTVQMRILDTLGAKQLAMSGSILSEVIVQHQPCTTEKVCEMDEETGKKICFYEEPVCPVTQETRYYTTATYTNPDSNLPTRLIVEVSKHPSSQVGTGDFSISVLR